jgi:glycosyltransferase involved in cell wall biosynthesis
MRIGFSTSVIQRGKTGIAQYVFALLRAMAPHTSTHEFYLFVLEEDLPLFEFTSNRMKLITVPEEFRPAGRNIGWHQTHLPRLARELSLDVLHVPSYRRMLWPKPCPLVATIHDLAPFHIRGKYDWKRMIYGRLVVRRLAWRQDTILTVSENTARDLFRYFHLPRERVRVIWNGIDHQRFRPGDNALARALARKRWGLEQPFFLYISRLEHPAKNHVRLIEAFNRFKASTRSPWQLAFSGSDWHGAERIHAMAAASPYKSDIRFLGFVDDDSLPDLYRAAEVFVYPSLFEGFGFPPIEAMACGCPVISSTRGSLKEVVAAAARTVDPESLDDMTSALTNLATDPGLRQRLSLSGFNNARRFDWSRNAEEVLSAYSRVARNMTAT